MTHRPAPDPTLPHTLDRRVLIRARRETVFRYFTDSERFAAWWGAGSTIDPRPGGKVHIRHPNAVEAGGEVIELDAPRRIVFTLGYANGQPIALGASRVTIELEIDPGGTRLTLHHAFAAGDATARDQHVQGWRYQLSVFANVVSNQVNAAAAERVDAWFAALSEPDAARRLAHLDACVAPSVGFRDRFSMVDSRADLEPHLAAVHVFMPGMRLERTGEVRHCLGTAVADWVAKGSDGAERGRGTNVFGFDLDGKIDDVVGLWA